MKQPDLIKTILDKLKELELGCVNKTVRQQYVYLRDTYGPFIIDLRKKMGREKIIQKHWF